MFRYGRGMVRATLDCGSHNDAAINIMSGTRMVILYRAVERGTVRHAGVKIVR